MTLHGHATVWGLYQLEAKELNAVKTGVDNKPRIHDLLEVARCYSLQLFKEIARTVLGIDLATSERLVCMVKERTA